MGSAQSLDETIAEVLRTPAAAEPGETGFGFPALEPDGATRQGLSAQVLAAMAREALTRCIPGVTFNEITAHRDEQGQLMRIEVDYMDEIHDPSSRQTVVDYAARHRA